MTDGFAVERSLLGKRVRVRLGDQVIVEGQLMGFGDGGEFEILESDGFVHYCWPNLGMEEVPPPCPHGRASWHSCPHCLGVTK